MTIFLPVLNGLEVLVFMHDLSRFRVCPLEFVEINWTANTHSAFLREVFFSVKEVGNRPSCFHCRLVVIGLLIQPDFIGFKICMLKLKKRKCKLPYS